MTASCCSDHLFYRAPLGNRLFHTQVARFQSERWRYCRKYQGARQYHWWRIISQTLSKNLQEMNIVQS